MGNFPEAFVPDSIPAGWTPKEWAINLERISRLRDFPWFDLSHLAERARRVRKQCNLQEKQDARTEPDL